MGIQSKAAEEWVPQWAINPHLRVTPGHATIDIWLFDLDSPLDSIAETLDSHERLLASRFVFPTDAKRYVAAHSYLRVVLGDYLHCDPALIAFERGTWGKPALPAAMAKGLTFNLAHSANIALVAIGPASDLGVDVERVRILEDWSGIANQVFASTEVQSLSSRSGPAQIESFFATWTRKEAIIKMWGQGLSADLKAFEVPTDPSCSNCLLTFERPGRKLEQVRLWTFKPLPDFWAALAVPASTDLELRFWRHN